VKVTVYIKRISEKHRSLVATFTCSINSCLNGKPLLPLIPYPLAGRKIDKLDIFPSGYLTLEIILNFLSLGDLNLAVAGIPFFQPRPGPRVYCKEKTPSRIGLSSEISIFHGKIIEKIL
jgi:hypothetical protein